MIHYNIERLSARRLITILAAIFLALMISLSPALAEKTAQEQAAPNQADPFQTAQEQTQAGGAVYEADPETAYRPLIDMYRAFEKSGFTLCDEFLSNTLLARAKFDPDVLGGMDMDLEGLVLQFALNDLNQDEVPELLIRAVDPASVSTILSAYTLKDGAPVSILQKETGREVISIRESGIIDCEWSHMGILTDLYFTLAPGAAELTLEEGLYTDWNRAARKEEYSDLENAQIIQYGDHFKGLTVLIPQDTTALTPIGQEDWADLTTDNEAGKAAPQEDEWRPLAAYPGGRRK
jgi:hypothetical protein